MPTIYSIRSAWMGEPGILSRKANDEAEYLGRSIKARERAKGETSIIISSSVPSCIQTAQAISKGFASEINNIVTPYLGSEEKNIGDIDRASKLITKYKGIHLFILVTEPEVLFKISEELGYIGGCSRLRFLEFIKFSTGESSSTESEKSKGPCEDGFDGRWFNLFS